MILVVDNTQTIEMRREVGLRIERRERRNRRRRRWLRAAYGSGRALGAAAMLIVAAAAGAGVVYGAGVLAWRLLP